MRDIFEDKEFMTLDLPKRQKKDGDKQGYHVYKNATEYVFVSAQTAKEAIANSGVDDPFKIERVNVRLDDVLKEGALDVLAEEVTEEVPQAEAESDVENTPIDAPAERESAGQEAES